MRFLIASDIHGAAEPCLKVKELWDKGGYDLLVLLGDLLYHGPRNDLPASYAPKKVIPVLSSMKEHIISVRGNCEAEVDQMVLPFPVLSESAMLFDSGRRIFLTHGHIHTPDSHPDGMDCFFSGHTHLPVLEKRDGIVYLNPGSTSIPKGGYSASYAVWDNGAIEIRRLSDSAIMAAMDSGGRLIKPLRQP